MGHRMSIRALGRQVVVPTTIPSSTFTIHEAIFKTLFRTGFTRRLSRGSSHIISGAGCRNRSGVHRRAIISPFILELAGFSIYNHDLPADIHDKIAMNDTQILIPPRLSGLSIDTLDTDISTVQNARCHSRRIRSRRLSRCSGPASCKSHPELALRL